ncbi:MAG TPA: PIN domain-containing protein [Thermodesulfobacteriota bacterium]|nr:PIN domain-containing protein [Thermodesulfobacteriota bacterium]
MLRFSLDTSCMIGAVCTWHEHHDRAAGEIERRLSQGETMIVAAPALVESYAVLTRLPQPHRLSPKDAFTLLEANFMTTTKMIALDSKSYRTLLRKASDEGIAGGRLYDAVIAACALRAKAEVLLTFNESHFVSLSENKIEIVVPGR